MRTASMALTTGTTMSLLVPTARTWNESALVAIASSASVRRTRASVDDDVSALVGHAKRRVDAAVGDPAVERDVRGEMLTLSIAKGPV